MLGKRMVCEVASIVALLRAGIAWRALTAARHFFVSFLWCAIISSNGFKLYCPLFGVLFPSTRDNFRIPIDRCIYMDQGSVEAQC